MAGNVIPDDGPTMESIYDDLGDHPAYGESCTPGVARMILKLRQRTRASRAVVSSALPASAASPAFSLIPES